MIVTKKISILSKIYFLIFMIFFLFIYNNLKAQLHKTIDSLQAIEQNCLDSGMHMENCSCEFSHEMDSILNIVYSNVRTNLNTQQKEAFKQEELIWLKKREINHEESRKESIKEGLHGSDVGMIACNDDAEFVIDRINAIIKKWDFKKIYSN
ncbi:MAG: hypothetical protein PW786_03245 [Arachidicoccus sp.]|nr:hypothetical protein [Arachidicoccus sp.]